MTSYVNLQRDIIGALSRLAREDPADQLRKIVSDARDKNLSAIKADIQYLQMRCGLFLPDEDWVTNACVEIFIQQIDDSGDKVVIRNLLGFPLHGHGKPFGFEEFMQKRGTGENCLRTNRLSQPGALKKGDILATGCKVLSPPREGGNGDVLIHLTGGFTGHWISVPSRIPIALLTEEDKVPKGYVDE